MFLWTLKAQDGFSLSTHKQQREFSFEKILLSKHMFSVKKTHLLEFYTDVFAYKFNFKKQMLTSGWMHFAGFFYRSALLD